MMQEGDLNIDDPQTFQTMIDELVNVWVVSILIWFFWVGKKKYLEQRKEEGGWDVWHICSHAWQYGLLFKISVLERREL